MNNPLFIVVFDDEMGLCSPMGWDDQCEGAICAAGSDPVAIFSSRADARKAINISAKFAALCKEQGKPENTDFLECRKFIRINPCRFSNHISKKEHP